MTIKLGQHRPMRVRRIGARHVLVLPAQQAQLVSIDDLARALATARAREKQLREEYVQHRAFVADLETQVAAFAALAIERDEDDPIVPQPSQPAPSPSPLPPTQPSPQRQPRPVPLPNLPLPEPIDDPTPVDPPLLGDAPVVAELWSPPSGQPPAPPCDEQARPIKSRPARAVHLPIVKA